MNARALVLLAVAGSLLAAMAVFGLSGSGARPLSPTADVTPSPTAAPEPPEDGGLVTPQPAAPPAVAHRPEALTGACAGCHRADGGWALCEAGAADPVGDCQACHSQAPQAGPVVIHHTPEDDGSDALCAVCHSDIAGAAPLQVDVVEAEECSQCHTSDLADVLPEDHADRSIVTCMVCHETELLAASALPHGVEGWERCSFCHGEGRLTALEGGHEGGGDEQCLSCHAGRETAVPKAEECMAMMANQEESGCTSCHSEGGRAPLPIDHDERSPALCGLCHSVDHHSAPAASHSLAGEAICTTCHDPTSAAALPESHIDRVPAMCEACHGWLPGAAPDAEHGGDRRSLPLDCPQPPGELPRGASGHSQ